MFLPPAILARLIGSEALGFNLWVALPFPLGAIGAYAFFARRCSAPAAALGSIVFTLCGPVVSSSNFPNSSWCVAALPWVLWAADRVIMSAAPRDLALLAAAIAFQGLAGEPVTMFTTMVLTLGYVLAVGAPGADRLTERVRGLLATGVGIALGVALSSIQVIPMIAASRAAQRGESITADAWSLRPTALLETVWLHLFGNYYTAQSLAEVPWLPLMYTGREPFFFSIYFGVPVLALAIYGLAGPGPRRWRLFWTGAAFVSIVAAFGSYTPVYPILRDHVPPFGTFRFPVKYIMAAAMAVAAGSAVGWDLLSRAGSVPVDAADRRRSKRARLVAVGFALGAGALIGMFAAATIYVPESVGGWLQAFATRLGDGTDQASEFLLRTVPHTAWVLVIVSLAAGLSMLLASGARPRRIVAMSALYGLVVCDLVIRASDICPALDTVHLAEPSWLSHTRADPNARFYVGGKLEGTLVTMDVDASRAYENAPGLTGSASRAALSAQAAFYPSAWQARELMSYDLPVLWPRSFTLMLEEFRKRSGGERERFLDTTGVRYRILPARRAAGRRALTPIPQFPESFLFDWGNSVTPRLSVVADARVVPTVNQQIDMLFAEDWDTRATVMIDREPAPAGTPGAPVSPSAARFVVDRSNRVTIEAGVDARGGYLLLLDSYSDDWRVTVDGVESSAVRANGLFRAVRLTPGTHVVDFVYRPRALVVGASLSFVAVLVTLWLASSTRARHPGLTWLRPRS
jgi:hypothetical protein